MMKGTKVGSYLARIRPERSASRDEAPSERARRSPSSSYPDQNTSSLRSLDIHKSRTWTFCLLGNGRYSILDFDPVGQAIVALTFVGDCERRVTTGAARRPSIVYWQIGHVKSQPPLLSNPSAHPIFCHNIRPWVVLLMKHAKWVIWNIPAVLQSN